MRIFLFLFTALLISNCGGPPSDIKKLKSENDSLLQELAKRDASVGIVNSKMTSITSNYTGQIYDIYISYPNNYNKRGKKYPVLVAFDAEFNFGAVSYICQRLNKDDLIPELFVVGIAYHGETDEDTYYSSRSRDFTPTEDKAQEERHTSNFKYGTGGAENFVKFLSLELFPYLRNNYAIREEDKTIYGHSFGGLLGTHLLINHPGLFDNYLLLSPSLWWNQKATIHDLEKNFSTLPNQVKVYIATGALEGRMVDDHLDMARILKKKDPDNSNIKSEILDGETHRSIFGRGFTNGLRFLYAKD